MTNKNAVVVPARTTTATSDRAQAVDLSIVAPVGAVEVIDRDLLAAVHGRLAAVVWFTVGDDGESHTRVRPYFTLTAARRAVEAARDRGQAAGAVLVELHPVGILRGTS